MDLELNFGQVPIRILDGCYVESGQPTRDAEIYLEQLRERLDEFRAFAAEQLLELYNEAWLDGDNGPLDVESFAGRMASPAIVLCDEPGIALVYFGDGGLFGGHEIEVSVEDGQPLSTDIVG